MVRILLFILAVVLFIVGYLGHLPLLYVAAVMALAAAGWATFNGMKRTHQREQEALNRPASRERELEELGIVEIRPRDKNAPIVPGKPPEPPQRRRPEPQRPPRRDGVDATESGPLKKEAVDPYLQSLLTSIGANTVCLLRQEGPTRYAIEGIVSRNAYARGGGEFFTRHALLLPEALEQPVALSRVGEHGVPADELGYYLGTISVRQVAMAVLPGTGEGATHFLLADTTEEDGLTAPQKLELLSHFADLLARMLRAAEPAPATSAPAPAEEQSVRPRREIIAEEMARARAEATPLAFILICPRRVEDITTEDFPEAERLLRPRREAAAGGRRVDVFGHLTWGVFFHGDPADAEAWAEDLQADLADETGLLEGGVCIGMALLTDSHESAEDLRHDARDALGEAYQTGAITVY